MLLGGYASSSGTWLLTTFNLHCRSSAYIIVVDYRMTNFSYCAFTSQGADCTKEFAALQSCLVANASSYNQFFEHVEEAKLLNHPKRRE